MAMNVEALLEMVRKHPLPWKDESFYYTDAAGTRVEDGWEVGDALASSGPSLAVAAIQLLRADPWISITSPERTFRICKFCHREDAHEPTCAREALRTALPAELRP